MVFVNETPEQLQEAWLFRLGDFHFGSLPCLIERGEPHLEALPLASQDTDENYSPDCCKHAEQSCHGT
jgi:hypothetical protein